MRASGFTGDDQLLEPTPIAPLPDLGPVRRSRRRGRLLALWTTVLLLLVGQIGAAVYLRLRRPRRQAAPTLATVALPAPAGDATPAAPAAVRDASTATQPTSLAARPPDAAAVPDTRAPAKKIAARTVKRATRTSAKTKLTATRSRPGPLPVAAGPVDDIAVPLAASGNAAKGERLLRMGCGLCHGRRTQAITPSRFTAKQWKLYFARAAHGRHEKLRGHFTRAELADVKAYLISVVGGR
jgi:hypothetical protein